MYESSHSFGSFELLYSGVPRVCTVTCIEAGSLWVINRRVFDAKLKSLPAAANLLEQKALLASCNKVSFVLEGSRDNLTLTLAWP